MANNLKTRRQKAEGRRLGGAGFLPAAHCLLRSHARGFSLIELVITITVLAILTLGTVPLVQVTVQRQKEQELRADLREMREAVIRLALKPQHYISLRATIFREYSSILRS